MPTSKDVRKRRKKKTHPIKPSKQLMAMRANAANLISSTSSMLNPEGTDDAEEEPTSFTNTVVLGTMSSPIYNEDLWPSLCHETGKEHTTPKESHTDEDGIDPIIHNETNLCRTPTTNENQGREMHQFLHVHYNRTIQQRKHHYTYT